MFEKIRADKIAIMVLLILEAFPMLASVMIYGIFLLTFSELVDSLQSEYAKQNFLMLMPFLLFAIYPISYAISLIFTLRKKKLGFAALLPLIHIAVIFLYMVLPVVFILIKDIIK